MMQSPIAVFRTGYLGDTLVTMPAIQWLKKIHPARPFIFISEKSPKNRSIAWDVLQPTGWFEEVLFYDSRSGSLRRFFSLWALALKLRKKRPGRLYYFSQDRRSAWQLALDWFYFRWVAQIRDCVGFLAVEHPQRLTTLKLPEMTSEWKRFLDLVHKDRTEIAPDGQHEFKLTLPVAEKIHAENFMHSQGLSSEAQILAVGPGSKMQAKRWAEECFWELGWKLLERYPQLQLIAVGGKEDEPLCNKLVKKWRERTSFFCQESILKSAAVLSLCTGYVGNDTGTMHLAASVGIPCVGIFSARDYPGLWNPIGEKNIILRHEVPCSGCHLEMCVEKNNMCLKEITVNEVFEAVRRLLET